MPSSVIKAGAYDKVLLAEQMGDEISHYLDNHKVLNRGGNSQKEDSLREIFKLMTKKTGTDFSRYKPSTIKRRIEHRLETLKPNNINEYRDHIQKIPIELGELFKTVLIGVTGFFRDREALEALKKYVAEILDQKETKESLRIWSVGYATGDRNCEPIFELTREQLYENADLIRLLMTEEDCHTYEKISDESAQNQESFRFEYRIHTYQTDQFRWIKLDSRAMQTEKGETIWYGNIQDISALKKVKSSENNGSEFYFTLGQQLGNFANPLTAQPIGKRSSANKIYSNA